MDVGREAAYRAQASKFTNDQGNMFIHRERRRRLKRRAVKDAERLARIHPDANVKVLNTKTQEVVWP